MNQPRVLVVDDHPINLKLVSVLLRTEGFAVRTAGNVQQASASMAEELPDIVLMDIQLPGTDGLTFTRQIRADERTAQLCVVALTAYAMPDDRTRALDAGCDDYIAKPIDTRTLPQRLRDALARRRG